MSFGNFILKSAIKVVGLKERNNTEDIPLIRKKIAFWSQLLPQPKNITRDQVEFENFDCEWFIPNEYETEKVLLYFHGGGYAIRSPKVHSRLITRLARQCGAKGFAVYYRLAPEHPYPAAIDDSIEAYKYLLALGFKPQNIIVGGDSAGGGLTIGFCVKLKELRLAQPAAIACISPWIDLEGNGTSNHEEWRVDGILTNSRLRVWGKLYANGANIKDPCASPIHADLSNLPPLLIQVSEHELLYSDSTRLREQAEKAGVIVEMKAYPKMVHVWHVWSILLPEAKTAMSEIAEFYRKHL